MAGRDKLDSAADIRTHKTVVHSTPKMFSLDRRSRTLPDFRELLSLAPFTKGCYSREMHPS